jgi:hypothetical protein
MEVNIKYVLSCSVFWGLHCFIHIPSLIYDVTSVCLTERNNNNKNRIL